MLHRFAFVLLCLAVIVSAVPSPFQATSFAAPVAALSTAGSHKLLLPLVRSSAVSTPPATTSTGPSVYWGAYIKGNTYGYSDAPWDMRTVDKFEANAQKKISILHWGQAWYSSTSWPNGYYPFVPSLMDAVVARGSIPMINWSSWDISAGGTATQPDYQLIDIIEGKHDAYIRQWATAAKTWGKPFFLRHNHEMNGTWYPWSEAKNGNQAGEYVRAWRHVHDIFTSVGATNVTWVWCPNTVYAGSIPLSGLYPGDAYVDWTCVDGYNWAGVRSEPWQTLEQVIRPTYTELQRIAPTKPVMIGETSSSERGGSKAAWITDALTTQIPQRFPNIKALVWFNWNTDGADWVIETSSSAQAAFAKGIASGYYAANTFGNLPKLTKVQPLSPIVTNTVNTAQNLSTSDTVQNTSFETIATTP